METQQQNLLNEEPDVILDGFIGGKINIMSLLNVQKLSPEQLTIGLKIIHKACNSTNDMHLVANILCDLAAYKDRFITAVSILIGKEHCGVKIIDKNILESVMDLLHSLIQRVPSASINILEILLPQLSAVCVKCCNDEYTINLIKKLKELEKQKEACVATIKGTAKSLECIVPPCDFHLLPNIPSKEEIFSGRPFLRPAIVEGPFENVEHYLDIHFRLMREDMFRDFRKCLRDMYFQNDLENGRLYQNTYLEKIEQTSIGMFLHFVVPIQSKIDWKTTKRLVPGSLLCISCDGFKNFHFGSIYARKDDGKQGNICYLELSFESMKEPKFSLTFYDMLEAGGYYESYSYILQNLKKLSLSNFPFQRCLIDYEGCNDVPFALNCKQENSLKNFQSEINDENQSLAFELAIRNKIALIQGPPGTGKSYLGVQIARYLMENLCNKKPLIVMCYTNHALDQFLEKMLDFTEKIVRIGGQSKSEKLESHNLSSLTRSISNHRAKNKQCGYDAYNEVLNKSYNIVLQLYHNRYGDDGFPSQLYGQVKRRSKIISRHIDNLIKSVKYPFAKATMNVRLCDILGLHDVLINGKLKGDIFNTVLCTAAGIKLFHWLMMEKSFSDIYNEMVDFKQMLTEELLNAFHTYCLVHTVTKENIYLPKLELSLPTKLLIKLCINQKNDLFFNQHNTSCRALERFIQKHLHSSENVFPLFFRSAIRYTEKHNVTVDNQCNNLWMLDLKERWKLLSILLFEVSTINIARMLQCKMFYDNLVLRFKTIEKSFTIETFESDCEGLKRGQIERNAYLLESADIIGMTTTGAAKNFNLLKEIGPKIYIVEEAAEVFESHIVASLVSNIQHLTLIGDHLQLRPSPMVYDLAIRYHLDVSLFERLFENGVPSICLKVQHRMRPSIAQLMVPDFYPCLENHPSVLEYENIAGVSSNVFFLSHSRLENENDENSHSNSHEASLVVTLCEYLISQGHEPSSITILTTYVRQLHLIRRYMQNIKSIGHVLATTVDNYQGEENDIILLSFVRSNAANKIGFIKTQNRLCVALSRARKGLYCVGNFDMFASQSKIWQSLINKLLGLGNLGEKMEVNCHKHPELKYLVGTSSDLKDHMKRGCYKPCCEILYCGHACALPCHGKHIDHRGKQCDSKCIPAEHLALECDKTETKLINQNKLNKVTDAIPSNVRDKTCADSCNTKNGINDNHHIKSKCGEDFSCNETSDVVKIESEYNVSSNAVKNIFNCGHTIKYLLSGIQETECQETVVSYVKCGETVSHICGKKPNHKNCSSPLQLQCGHTVSCNTDVSSYICSQNVNTSLQCGHNKLVSCHLSKETNMICIEKIKVDLPCSHNLSMPCHEFKSKDMECKVEIKVALPCNHTSKIACCKSKSLNLIKCKELCGSPLPCDHKCSNVCYSCSSSGEHAVCEASVKKQLRCGHIFDTKCNAPPELCHQRCMYRCAHTQCVNPCHIACFPCKKPCTWNCEHYHCENTCSELCDRPPCEKSCPKLNPSCGHQCSGFCGEPCPTACQHCDGIVGVDQKFILLEDCGHSIPHTELSNFLMKHECHGCPKCPKCQITITKNVRFGNFLKTYYKSRNKINSKNV